MAKTNWSYDSVANFYQTLAQIYSLGLIRRSKNLQLMEMKEGTKVLYVGCGSGEDAVQAAKLGAKVTCIDISPKMIRNIELRLQREKVSARLICGDIFEHLEYESYDIVTVNYFLNNFPSNVLPKLLKHITSLIKKDGKLMIADFFALSQNKVLKIIEIANFYVAVCFFWLLRVAPLHKYQNYVSYFKEIGISLERIDTVRFLNIGIPLYGNIVGFKN
ncbi:MAG: class I SAM-dependent methyltransferase [Eubacterium sp.]|nr:class I SAM-dependent methyltransferase [Eubacterium sp.]